MLYKADTFLGNFVRAVLLILCRLVFLACLGVLAASFLSFPVAILFCLVIFVTGDDQRFHRRIVRLHERERQPDLRVYSSERSFGFCRSSTSTTQRSSWSRPG